MGNKKTIDCALPLQHKRGIHWKSLLFATLCCPKSLHQSTVWTTNIAIFKVFLIFLMKQNINTKYTLNPSQFQFQTDVRIETEDKPLRPHFDPTTWQPGVPSPWSKVLSKPQGRRKSGSGNFTSAGAKQNSSLISCTILVSGQFGGGHSGAPSGISKNEHRIMEEFGLEGIFECCSVQPILQWAGTSSTRPSCSLPHPPWPWTLWGTRCQMPSPVWQFNAFSKLKVPVSLQRYIFPSK